MERAKERQLHEKCVLVKFTNSVDVLIAFIITVNENALLTSHVTLAVSIGIQLDAFHIDKK